MDDFLSSIQIRKRKEKPCSLCQKPEKMQEGEIYCKKCRVKVKKLDNDSYHINFSSGD